MPLTYSAPFGPPIQATKLDSILSVLQELPDNTQKLINPHDVRDAVYTLWETTIFKPFTGDAGVEYIGIERTNIQDKIYFGKRQFQGLDVMNSSLLDYNLVDILPGYLSDFYFYNNKSDGFGNQDTRISILGGTDSILNLYAPYIETVRLPSNLDFNIVNRIGDISIESQYNRVAINTIPFPTVAQTSTVSDGQILRWRTLPDAQLYWEDVTFNSSSLGQTGSTTSIVGDPVLVNGYPLEFTDLNPTINALGGIVVGRTFSNYPIVELLRELLYPYLGPLSSISMSPSVMEYNQSVSATVTSNYTITKRTDDIIASAGLSSPAASPLSSFATAAGSGLITVSGNVNWSVSSANQNLYPSANIFRLRVTDSIFTTFTASTSMRFVLPYFFGFYPHLPTDFGVTPNGILSALYGAGNYLVTGPGNQNIPLNGTGYIYFCYDANYGPLTQTLDNNGFSLVYSTNLFTVNSPAGKWTNKAYRFYWFPSPTTLAGQVYQYIF